MPRTVGFSEDRFIDGLSQLASRVHQHGAKIAAQLNHGGKVAQEDIIHGRPILVPSIPEKGGSDMFALLTPQELGNFVKAAGPDGLGPRYHEMEQADIDTLVSQFASAARRAAGRMCPRPARPLPAPPNQTNSSTHSPAIARLDSHPVRGCGAPERAL